MTQGTFGPVVIDCRDRRPPRADERTSVIGFLRWHRQTLELKCGGLAPAELSRRSVHPSALSLLGLVRHIAEGEQFWFRQVMAGETPPALFPDTGAFECADADAATVENVFELWRAEIQFAENFVADAASLDVTGDEPGEGPVSLRWVLLHMIEEYARHNGHADLLRENIDGTVGQ